MPPGGFFKNLAKNSRIASCTRIDESLPENVSRSGQKFLAPAENIEEPTDFFIVAYHLVISRVSILHKEIRFRARTFVFLHRSRLPPAGSSTVQRPARSSILTVIFRVLVMRLLVR